MGKWLPAGLVGLALALSACTPEETVNRPPVAQAGDDVRVFLGDAVALDGSASFDPDLTAITHAWTVESAPAGSVLAPGDVASTDATLSFTPAVPGGYVFSLTVTDELGESSRDAIGVLVFNVLRVTGTVPADGAVGVAGRTSTVVFFSEPIRPWTAENAVMVEDITDPAAPVPVLGNITLDDANTSLVFTPVVPWNDLTPYRLTVTTAPVGLDGAPLRDAVVSDFTGSALDLTPPTILSVSPPDAAIDAPIATVVTVVFSEPVDPATVPGAFRLDAGATDGTVIVSSGDTKATFVPADTIPDPDVPQALATGTTYAVSLADTITDQAAAPNLLDGDADGTAGAPFASSFTTVATDASGPPKILSISPFPGSLGVSVKLPMVVTFSEPVAPASVIDSTFFLSGGTVVPTATITMAPGNTAAILSPDANLETSTQYDVTVTDGITDLTAVALDGDGDGTAGGIFGSFFRTGLAPPPTVLTVTPVATPTIDTTTIIDVYGEDFVDGATVFILGGGVLVNSTTFVSETQLQADVTISPSATIGPRSVQVTNPDGLNDVGLNLLDIFDRPPVVASANPGALAQGAMNVNVDVFGQYFRTLPAVTVSGADVTVNNVAFVSGGVSSQVTLDLTVGAAAAIGFRDITLTNPDLQQNTLIGALEITAPPPVLNLIDITTGRRKETIDVTLTGTDFQAGATVGFGAGIGVTAVDDTGVPTQLVATIAIAGNAAQGARNVTVTNVDGASDTLNNAFDVLRAIPIVTGSLPNTGARQDPAGAFNVVVNGADFDCSGGMAPGVDFNDAGVTVNTVTCTGTPGNTEFETEVTANITIGAGATAPVPHDITVTNPGEGTGGTGFGLFTVLLEKPLVVSITPNPRQGETRDVTIGGNFFQTPAPQVTTPQAGITINSVTYVDPMTLTANVTVDYTVAFGSTYDVNVLNADGQATIANMLTVDTAPAPSVLSVGPASGVRGTNNLILTILGSGFQPGAGVTTVEFSDTAGVFPDAGNDVMVNSVTVNSGTTLTVDVNVSATADTAGPRAVRVTNPVGMTTTGTGMSLFTTTFPPPVVLSVSPSSGSEGDPAVAVQVNGTDFQSGAEATTEFGADIAEACTFVSSMQIDCTLDLSAAAVGFRNVTVTNPDSASDTLVNGFEVLSVTGAPSIASVTPGFINQGQTKTVHIIGSNFNAAASVLVSGPGVAVANTTVFGTTRIDVDVTVSCADIQLGSRDITVINPDAQSATSVAALEVRNGVVINEVVTRPRTVNEFVELYNGSNCTFNIENWRLDIIDNNFEIYVFDGSETETYSAGSRTAWPAGAWMDVDQPDGGNNRLGNDVFLALITDDGRTVDDLEIGDDRENDGPGDGAVAPGNDGNNNDGNNEAVARCPDGHDTHNDVNDFFQDEAAGFEAAETSAASNNGECPPCADGADNDGDGWFDLDDADCLDDPLNLDESTGGPTTECNDGMDNGDGDGLADANDPDCFDGKDDDESI